MRIYGVDFTSVPRRGKPITVAVCRLENDRLSFERLDRLEDFAALEALLEKPGPWVAGFDFPFGQSRRFIGNIGWPRDWAKYVDHAGAMDRAEFRRVLEEYKADRAPGDREHQRAFEKGTGAASPQKLYGVPVALMFYEGAPRLLRSGAAIPGLADGDLSRTCIEAYPGVLARHLIGRRSYKSEERKKRTLGLDAARRDILAELCGARGQERLGLTVRAPGHLAVDPTGDELDALLCAAQAGWAVRHVLDRPGRLAWVDPLEGWIADPSVFERASTKIPTTTRTARPTAPADAAARRAARPVIVYPTRTLPEPDIAAYRAARDGAQTIAEIIVPPRNARSFRVNAGQFFRIHSILGPQVGDLNLWAADDLFERFYSGKTRALHGTHLTTGDRMWSCFPYLRPIATITHDSLSWYGIDRDGGSVHDVIGTRCDPYTHRLLTGREYHHCCHSNLTRALAAECDLPLHEAEKHVHDVFNVFMCTGVTRDTGQYFMKASPVRPGDYLEFFAEIDLLGALSACPGGDCSSEHSSDVAACFPLRIEVLEPAAAPDGWSTPAPNDYSRSHGQQ